MASKGVKGQNYRKLLGRYTARADDCTIGVREGSSAVPNPGSHCLVPLVQLTTCVRDTQTHSDLDFVFFTNSNITD